MGLVRDSKLHRTNPNKPNASIIVPHFACLQYHHSAKPMVLDMN